MLIEQAIFTSANRGMVKGYQVVAKTPGVSREAEMTIHRWSPSKMSSENAEHWTINFFPVSAKQYAVSRTLLGGPEYSGRGGRQVVTRIALLNTHQMAVFRCNALRFASAALALGWLRLPNTSVHRDLEQIRMPDLAMPTAALHKIAREQQDGREASDPELTSKAAKLIFEGQRLAIIGAANPLRTAEDVIESIPEDERLQLSFTTGLPPANARPFQLHFLPHLTPLQLRSLQAEGVHVLEALQASVR